MGWYLNHPKRNHLQKIHTPYESGGSSYNPHSFHSVAYSTLSCNCCNIMGLFYVTEILMAHLTNSLLKKYFSCLMKKSISSPVSVYYQSIILYHFRLYTIFLQFHRLIISYLGHFIPILWLFFSFLDIHFIKSKAFL